MKFIICFMAVFLTATATAQNINVQRRDMKLASQQLMEKQTITNPVVADVDRILDGQATSSSVVTTVTTFLAQPDVCRNVTLTTGGTTADVAAGNVTISGTNIFGQAITENLAVTANLAGSVAGLKAFCTVTSVSIPIQDGAAATYDIGVGDVLGLHRCMNSAGHVVFAVFNNAYEATRPTCVAHATQVENNTCDINGTLDGSKTAEIFFVQNFRCFP